MVSISYTSAYRSSIRAHDKNQDSQTEMLPTYVTQRLLALLQDSVIHFLSTKATTSHERLRAGFGGGLEVLISISVAKDARASQIVVA